MTERAAERAAPDREADLKLIREALLRFDPETRADIFEAMQQLRKLPIPVALRILAKPRYEPVRLLQSGI